MPRSTSEKEDKTLGFFIECNADCESRWSCTATAQLRLLSFRKDEPPLTRKIDRKFTQEDNDYGFAAFELLDEILDLKNGYMENDTVVLEAFVQAETPYKMLPFDRDSKELKRRCDDIDELKKRLADSDAKLVRRNAENDRLSKRISIANGQVEDVLKKAKHDLDGYNKQLEKKDKKIAELKRKIDYAGRDPNPDEDVWTAYKKFMAS
jgi:DNA repair exonuclease SbcCD ATPase subunit